jgi:hypothetical protein
VAHVSEIVLSIIGGGTMSERYRVSCATENEVIDSVCARRVHGIVVLECQNLIMDFIPSDAARLGAFLIELAESAGWNNPESDDGK